MSAVNGGWLPEAFGPSPLEEGRVVQEVRHRIRRRRTVRRAAAFALVAVAAAGLLSVAGLRRPASGGLTAAREGGLPLTLDKVEGAVAVNWEGSPSEEYTVYRCESPRFDTCSLAGHVRGTSWLDTAPEPSTVIFYKVERAGGSGA